MIDVDKLMFDYEQQSNMVKQYESLTDAYSSYTKTLEDELKILRALVKDTAEAETCKRHANRFKVNSTKLFNKYSETINKLTKENKELVQKLADKEMELKYAKTDIKILRRLSC
jgi:Skp family chaperone for outer membrane proteins